MTKITFILANGQEHTVNAENGFSLMVAAKDNQIHEMRAICNGCCSCGTCVICPDNQSDLANLSPRYLGEQQVLDKLKHTSKKSRLACQVIVSDALDGMRFIVGNNNGR